MMPTIYSTTMNRTYDSLLSMLSIKNTFIIYKQLPQDKKLIAQKVQVYLVL